MTLSRRAQYTRGRIRLIAASILVFACSLPFLSDGIKLDYDFGIRLFLVCLLALKVLEASKVSLIIVTVWSLGVLEAGLIALVARGLGTLGDPEFVASLISHTAILILLYSRPESLHYMVAKRRMERRRRRVLAEETIRKPAALPAR